MNAFARKNLTCLILKRTSPACRFPLSFSFSLNYFCTLSETQFGFSSTIFHILLRKHDFPHELASRVASKLTRVKNPEKVDSVLSFLKESGFSNTQLERIAKYRPRVLAASLERCIKPKIKIFRDLGISSDDISRIISSNPTILHISVDNNIIPSLSVMKGLFGSNNEVARVLRKAPRFLTTNFQNTVVPNIEFLKSYGIPMERIRTILSGYPCAFRLKPEVIRQSVEKAKEMGLSASSKTFIYAIPAIISMSSESWELKLQSFRNLGFSDNDILTIFRKHPRVLYTSVEKIKKIKEVLLATGKFNISTIVNFPRSLTHSVENRYMPRLRILGILESRNLIKEWPGLGTICQLSDAKFFERFIRPFSNEVGKVYNTKRSVGAKES